MIRRAMGDLNLDKLVLISFTILCVSNAAKQTDSRLINEISDNSTV